MESLISNLPYIVVGFAIGYGLTTLAINMLDKASIVWYERRKKRSTDVLDSLSRAASENESANRVENKSSVE